MWQQVYVLMQCHLSLFLTRPTERVPEANILVEVCLHPPKKGFFVDDRFNKKKSKRMDFHLYAWRHHILRPHSFIVMFASIAWNAICNRLTGTVLVQEVIPRESQQIEFLYKDDFNTRWATRCAYHILYTLHSYRTNETYCFQRMVTRHKLRNELEDFISASPAQYRLAHLDQRLNSKWAHAHFIEFAALCPLQREVSWDYFLMNFGGRDGYSPNVQKMVLDMFLNELED